FTGKFIAAQVAKLAKEKSITWAVGGRNANKLGELNDWLFSTGALSEGDRPAEILVADCADTPALEGLGGRARVLINATGPFRFWGEAVVAACVAAGCHYVDITGEPEFIERCRVFHHQRALESGVLVVNSCGFDSIPADLGAMFTAAQFPGGASAIEAFITGSEEIKAHITTLECAIHGFKNQKGLRDVRRQAEQ
ncbi:unnamed protein product, partial [Heterosigma akashiwo]